MAQKLKTLSAVTITTAGTRVRVSESSIFSAGVVIQAPSVNSGNVFVGDETVSSANGLVLTPGDSVSIDADTSSGNFLELDLKSIYVDAASNGDKIRVSYISVKR